MREMLEQLLQAVDVPNPERAQLRWDEYREGADSTDPAVKSAADAAFATLLAWHGGGLYRHIWGFIRSDQAEDVFQDVLRKLHEKRRSPRLADFNGSVLPWLRRVAIHECVDAHRRATRRRGRENRAARPEEDQQRGNSGELQEMLAVALARLTREEREAIALHYFEGLDRQQAAQILGIHRDTLAKRVTQALTRLQKLIPVPVGILVGGMSGIPTALTAKPPALTAARLGELVRGAWVKAAAPGSSFVKATGVVTALLLGGGLAVGGWGLTREPLPTARSETRAAVQVVSAGPEKLQARNLRLFATEVRPKLIESLRMSILGEGGSAEITRVDAYDTRIECDAVIRHGPPNTHVTRVNIVHDAAGGEPRFRIDLRGDGRWRGLDPRRPIHIDNPFTGKRTSFGLPAADKALAAYLAVPWADERLAAEADARFEALRRAAACYEGAWYLDGDPAQTIQLWFGPREKPGVWYKIGDGGAFNYWIDLTVEPDGRLRGVAFHHQIGVLSPDGQRVDFPGTGHCWTRQPTKPKS